jgi:hypothetical protein
VWYDENGIGGDGENCGDNDAQLGRMNVFYHGNSGENYLPRAFFFDLEPGVIKRQFERVAAWQSLPSGIPREPYARRKWVKDHYNWAEHKFS